MNQEELKQRLVELIEKTKRSMWGKSGLSSNLARNYYLAEALIANGVTIRERGEWKFNKDGSGTCNRCGRTQKNVWDYDNWQSFCGCCGADMRGGKDE